MNTFLGITSSISKEEIIPEAIKNSKYMYMEGYLVASPTGKEAAIEARELAESYGVKTALTFSDVNMVKFFREGLMEMIGPKGVDLLFCNESEALSFTQTQDIFEAREKLKKVSKTFVITRGENGAMIFDGVTFIEIEPYSVKAVDTNGAGDMYAGAFLFAITHNHSHASAGKLASLAASRVVGQFGPRLKWHETQEIRNHILGDA
jgi:sugar/nucleoside kinase (ribokinase family)